MTLQYCSGFCHTLTWISHGCTCVPHREPPSHLPPYPTGKEEKGTTEDKMVGWHPRLDGHEFEQAPGVDDRH